MTRAHETAIAKIGPGSTALEYLTHDRAVDIYNSWAVGFSEGELAKFYGVEVEEVKRDMAHIMSTMSPRLIIHDRNNRLRIVLQREYDKDFENLMSGSLKMGADQYIAAGISPAGVLKEYREATGMVQKAEPLIQVNTQINNPANAGIGGKKIRCAEDMIRMVLAETTKTNKTDENIIDAEEDSAALDIEAVAAESDDGQGDSSE
jgi:hypothetical protein